MVLLKFDMEMLQAHAQQECIRMDNASFFGAGGIAIELRNERAASLSALLPDSLR